MRICPGCGVQVPQPRSGYRKWCSDYCRKQSCYGGTCVDCGTKTKYTGRGVAPSERCPACALEARRLWDRDTIVAAVNDFTERYAHPPSAVEWHTTQARRRGLEDIAVRWEADACWPSTKRVIEVFGTWNAALTAAGYEARLAHRPARAAA